MFFFFLWRGWFSGDGYFSFAVVVSFFFFPSPFLPRRGGWVVGWLGIWVARYCWAGSGTPGGGAVFLAGPLSPHRVPFENQPRGRHHHHPPHPPSQPHFGVRSR